MTSLSCTLASGKPVLIETWRRYYNGPNAGLIDVEVARREVPWLVGESSGVTFGSSAREPKPPARQIASHEE